MARPGFALLALAIVALPAESPPARAAALPSRKDAWIRVETAHFTLYSSAGESKTKEIGLNLEKLRAVLLLFKQSSTASSPVPTSVFVFKSDSALEPYKPLYRGKPSGVAGYFLGTSDGNYIALAASWNIDPRPIVYHEYLHYFLRSNFPPQPPWYEEGLADLYSTFQATAREASIGLPVESHVWRLRSDVMLPLGKLFAVRQDSPEYNEESRKGLFYAESWALVHYLMRGDPRRTPQLARFLELLQQGRPQDEAFREAFRTDYAGLLAELSGYLRVRSFPYRRFTLPELKVPTEMRTEPIDYEQTLFRLGDLLAHGPVDRAGEAETHFRMALDSNPSHPGALAGLGLLRMREEKYGEASEFFRMAIAAGSRDFRVYFRYGELLMLPLSNQPFVPGHLEVWQRQAVDDARAAFRKSIELDGAFAEAHAALGKTYLFEAGSRAANGILELETAMAALPSRKDLALALAELYDQRGDEEKGDELLRRALGPEGEQILAQRKRSHQFRDALDRVNVLVKEQKEDEAITLLEQIVSSAPSDAGQILGERLEALRRDAARSKSLREYNDAVLRYNKRDLEGALAGFRNVAATAEDSELAKSAREQADWVRRLLARKSRTRPAQPKGN